MKSRALMKLAISVCKTVEELLIFFNAIDERGVTRKPLDIKQNNTRITNSSFRKKKQFDQAKYCQPYIPAPGGCTP